MKKRSIVLNVTGILLFSVYLFSGCQSAEKKIPEVEKGVIDLREWDFKQNGTIDLDGEWLFFWKTDGCISLSASA